MKEFTITAIRYALGENLSLDKATQLAERFVSGLKKGQRVMLAAEPRNPTDPNAIAAYINYERVGYVGKEETCEVHPLLDERHQCDGVVERTDGHITFFISIPGASETGTALTGRERILPESPLSGDVRMPFAKDESRLELIASRLAGMEVNEAGVHEIIHLSELYVPLLKLSICHEDTLLMNRIEKMLRTLCSRGSELGMNEDELSRCRLIYNKVREAVGDIHRSSEHWPERLFVAQLDRLREDERVAGCLYQKYCDAYLGKKSFAEADRSLVAKEHDRLTGWLDGMAWSELRSPVDLHAMGLKVNYLGLSRDELYDLFSVLLLIEKLNTQMSFASVCILPAELASEEAMRYWEELHKSGFVDASYRLMPDITRKQAMYIAEAFAKKLGIKSKWKTFESLWNVSNLAQEKWDMQETGVMPTRYKEIDVIFKD